MRLRYSTRWLALKLLENDKAAWRVIDELPEAHQIREACVLAARRVKEETGDDSETAIMDAKYGFIRGALKEAGYKVGHHDNTYHVTHKLDALVTNRWLGFPFFFALLFLM